MTWSDLCFKSVEKRLKGGWSEGKPGQRSLLFRQEIVVLMLVETGEDGGWLVMGWLHVEVWRGSKARCHE